MLCVCGCALDVLCKKDGFSPSWKLFKSDLSLEEVANILFRFGKGFVSPFPEGLQKVSGTIVVRFPS